MSTLLLETNEGHPLGRAEALAAKVSRMILLTVCVGPIAVFPIGLAFRAYAYYVGIP